MKTIGILFLLFSLIGAGCSQDEAEVDEKIWEISPASKKTSIQFKKDGIEFKFCLLNEKGEPATIFKEGENFKFHFEVTNKSGKDLYYIPDFAYYGDDGFCRVMSVDNEDRGKPFELNTLLEVGIGGYPFNSNETILFEVNWADEREGLWDFGCATYRSLHQVTLPKGKYYTQFSSQFKFEKAGDIVIDISELSFRINFEIN